MNNIKHIIGLGLFGLYLIIALPTVYWGDGGFLLAASYSLGIPHPTGHPLFAILAKFFSFLPLGNIAFRMNIFGAFLNLACFYLVYEISLGIIPLSGATLARTDGSKRLISLLAAISFATSSMILFQARAIETYSLNLFLSLLVVWMIVREDYLTAFFIAGLAWGNHSLLIFGLLIPVFAVFLASTRKSDLAANLTKAILFLFLGLSVYFYLPVRAHADPIVNHGNPDSYGRFLWVVTAEQFRENTFSAKGFFESLSLKSAVFAAKETFLSIYRNVSLAWLVLGFLGLVSMAGRSLKIAAFFLAAILIQIAITIPPTVTIGLSLEERGIVGYYLVAFALIFILGAPGLCYLVDFINERLKEGLRKPAVRIILAAVLLAGITGFVMTDSKNYIARSEDHSALLYGRETLNSMDWGGTFLTVSDAALYISSYMQACEGARPDLTVINRSILFNEQGFSIFTSVDSPYSSLAAKLAKSCFSNKEYDLYLEMLSSLGPVYIEPGSSFMPSPSRIYPAYMVFRYGNETDLHRTWHLKKTEKFKRLISGEEWLADRESTADFAILEYNLGNFFLKRKDYSPAEYHYNIALILSPSMDEALANLLYLYFESGKYAEAIALGSANMENLKSPAAFYNLALSLVKTGRREEARNILAFALKNKNNPSLRKLFDSIKK